MRVTRFMRVVRVMMKTLRGQVWVRRRGSWGLALLLTVAAGLWQLPDAQAGVFTVPRFVTPGEFAIGFEPELTLSDNAGLGANLKYDQGITELMHAQAIIGSGGGPRRFRAGGNLVFDFFPDTEKQPGIGIAGQAIYYRGRDNGQLEVTGIPYIHKSFTGKGGEFDPFLAVPFGFSFSSGRYKAMVSVVVGSSFQAAEHFRYVFEVGIAVNNAFTYVAGGVAYYH